jgi:hypothetical protein
MPIGFLPVGPPKCHQWRWHRRDRPMVPPAFPLEASHVAGGHADPRVCPLPLQTRTLAERRLQ